MNKVTLTVALALLSMKAIAQHETYVLPALNEKMVKALPYYFYLDTAKYKVTYQGELLPVEPYKGKARYVLVGHGSGELRIEKLEHDKRDGSVDTSIYLSKNINFSDPRLLVYLNGTAAGKEYRLAKQKNRNFQLLAYVEGSSYEEPLQFSAAEVRFQKDGQWNTYHIEKSSVLPDWLMRSFFEAGAKVLQVKPQFKWMEGDKINGETVEFYFEQ